jgi:hypothetical protein
VHRDQRRPERDLICQFLPVPLGAFRKRSKYLQPPGQMADIRARLADEDIGFKLATDAYIKAQPRYQSVLHLQMFNTLMPDPDISFRLSEILADGTFEPLGTLISSFDDPTQARMTIMSLARRRRLRIDLTKPITNDLEISLFVPGWL